jgi:serine-type D-Ala-D-Ala carboxypeptidase/endopeptidase (penicillin-binding protein 4)
MMRFFLLSFAVFLFSCSAQRKITTLPSAGFLNDSSLLNAHVGVYIFDPLERKVIYEHQSEKYFVPASNTKIPTCYVAMKYLGDSLATFGYSFSGDTIFIQPSGDPVFLHPEYPVQKGLDLLKKYKVVSIERTGFSNFLGSGWSWNDYKEGYMAQRSDLPMYGNVARFRWNSQNEQVNIFPSFFKNSMEISGTMVNGFDLNKPWEENRFLLSNGRMNNAAIPFRPDLTTIQSLLGDTLKNLVTMHAPGRTYTSKIFSHPTDSMLKPLMHRSDNFFAEQTLVMAAKNFTGSLNLNRIIDTVLKTDFADLPHKPRWVDGSGLSRYNLFTPASLVGILQKINNEFGMERIKEIFPGANEGTLSGYYTNYPDRFYAKTGTLSGVVALSGFMYTNSGKLLIFSVLVNNHQSQASLVRRAVEKFLGGFLKD